MATSSKYISLSNSVLLEYEYRDQAGSTYTYTAGPGPAAGTAPWYLMNDAHDDSTLIFNQDGFINPTGNVRTRMGASIETTQAKYGYLFTSQSVLLNDYDPDLTSSASLPVNFTATQGVLYEVVRLHLTQGFNFENYEGMYFRLAFNNNASKKIRYLNMAYRKADNYAQINPNPFVFGGKYYSSYIEFKVPALYNLVKEYTDAINSGAATVDLPSSRLTNGFGPHVNALIETEFGWIQKESSANNMSYFNVYELKKVDLPTLDSFSMVSAVVQAAPSTSGDYIELYAAASGTIIDNFITTLNNVPGNDYIILHELKVSEFIWTPGATAYWKQTSSLEFVQDSDYGNPINFRPVIQYPQSVSYKIDYTVRLFNRADQTSIWKTSSAQFNNVLMYSKNLQKIALGVNPVQPKVYNKIFEKNVQMTGIGATSANVVDTKNYAKYITSFLENNQVSVTAQNAYLQRNPTTSVVEVKSVGNSKTETVFAQGLCKFQMTSSDTYVKFTIYEGDPTASIRFLDLSGLGKLYLNFFTDSGATINFLNYQSPEISSASGEVLFKIPAKNAAQISKYNDKTFTITNINDEDETQLYTGTFINVGNAIANLKDRKISNQDLQLEESNTAYIALRSLYDNSTSQVSSLTTANEQQNTMIQNLQTSLDEKIQENNFLIQDDATDEQQKAELEAKISEYEALLAATPVNTEIDFCPVDPECPKAYVNPKGANVHSSPDSPYSN